MADSVFLSYDQAALDYEYDNQAKVPNWAEVRKQLAADSEATRAAFDCHLDQRYGPHPRQVLDVFPTEGDGPHPVHLFIHGGYWQRNDKSGSSYVARTLVPAAYLTVVTNYGLIPDVTMDTVVEHCRAALEWVYRNAAGFGGDPARISVSGHSAGGHLITMLMATDWAARGLPADVIKAGCSISGIYDLEPVRLTSQNAAMALTAEEGRRNSPALLPPPATGRLLLAVGDKEGPEFHRQADLQAQAWNNGRAICAVMDVPGQDHFSMAAQVGEPASALSQALLAHLRDR